RGGRREEIQKKRGITAGDAGRNPESRRAHRRGRGETLDSYNSHALSVPTQSRLRRFLCALRDLRRACFLSSVFVLPSASPASSAVNSYFRFFSVSSAVRSSDPPRLAHRAASERVRFVVARELLFLRIPLELSLREHR